MIANMPGEAQAGSVPELRLRALEAGDAAEAVRISRRCAEAAAWSEEAYARLREAGCRGWVAQANAETVGFLVARCAADEAEILNLAVVPEVRRRGYATALVQEALREFRGQGVRRVFLEVRASNRGAMAFYEGLGFRGAGRRAGYYQNPREDGVCMALEFPG
ncbi:MAG: ribosomal protein S18-alanine N-acetyltransferase [Acidobacteriia bacterium]|nr:ribosomal protein S18-alanine N-acetyltransferase [Terriglobia bacterium]